MKTGINLQRCNVGSAEMHNTRDPKYIAAVNASPNKKYSIFEDRTETNVSWVNPEYSGKDLSGLLDELRNIYKSKVGQAPQEEDRVREIIDKKTGMKRTVTTAGWSPIREGVCPILPTTTISDFGPFIEWLQSKGLQVVRLDLHHDEGHTDELTGERKYNHHAHIIIDWIDHDTGKTRKLSKEDTKEMQTQLAASLQMERGVSKEITGADHLSPDEQRAKAAAQELKKLKAQKTQLNTQIDDLKEKLDILLGTSDKLADAAEKAIKAIKVKAALEQMLKTNGGGQLDGPSEGIYRVKFKAKYYYYNLDGQRINQRPLDDASMFIDGHATVRIDDTVAVIDSGGEIFQIIQKGTGLKR